MATALDRRATLLTAIASGASDLTLGTVGLLLGAAALLLIAVVQIWRWRKPDDAGKSAFGVPGPVGERGGAGAGVESGRDGGQDGELGPEFQPSMRPRDPNQKSFFDTPPVTMTDGAANNGKDSAQHAGLPNTTTPTSSSEQLAPHPRDPIQRAQEPEPDSDPRICDDADEVDAWSFAPLEERDGLFGRSEDLRGPVGYGRCAEPPKAPGAVPRDYACGLVDRDEVLASLRTDDIELAALAPNARVAPADTEAQKALVYNGRLIDNIPSEMRVGVREKIEVRLGDAEISIRDLTKGMRGSGGLGVHNLPIVETMAIGKQPVVDRKPRDYTDHAGGRSRGLHRCPASIRADSSAP